MELGDVSLIAIYAWLIRLSPVCRDFGREQFIRHSYLGFS